MEATLPVNQSQFNISGLTEKLNGAVFAKYLPIELRGPKESTPILQPFLEDKRIFTVQQYRLYQPHEMAILHPLTMSGKHLGDITVKIGAIEPQSPYAGLFEELTLRTYELIPLKNGTVLPVCKINFVCEYGEMMHDVERKDKIKTNFLFHKANLEDILPTHWFFK